MMKNNRFFGIILPNFLTCLMLVGFIMSVVGCKEEIDDANFAIKKEQTIADFLNENTNKFSHIKSIFDRVKLGRETDPNASSITSVLSARGNYTVFLPNDQAVTEYIAQFGKDNVDALEYEDARLIAYSCIIDNKDNSAYETPDFPTSGSFRQSNLADRLLGCMEDTVPEFAGMYKINGSSHVITSDLVMSNGVIHEVNAVIAPSSQMLHEMIAETPNLKIMSLLLKATGWDKEMAKVDERDTDYEELNAQKEPHTQPSVGTFPVASSRYLGFTGFVETDDVYKKEWNVELTGTSTEDTLAVLNTIKTMCQQYGVEGNADNNYTDANNIVNRFVAYHFIEGRVASDRFVQHFNEYGYKGGDPKNLQTKSYPVNVWDYYTTLGEHRGLVKVTQLGDKDPEHSLYLNRISLYDNGREGKYEEIGTVNDGVKMNVKNGSYDNAAMNGYYYPIDKILVYGSTMRDQMASERIRIDVTTMLPELLSNNIRGGEYTYLPAGYFNNITNETSGTVCLYLMSQSFANWRDYQGDEMMFSGQYDFTLRLPPVPKTDTYELRMGVSMNSLRGMVQIYLGTNPDNLQPVGLPFDMRQSVTGNPAIPWKEDTQDEVTDAENDKNMYNQGYLKGPKYFTIANGSGDQPVRDAGGNQAAIRRIIIAQSFDANKTYYLRFKSALKKLDSQLFVDYFEFVPRTVYNGAEPEDIW